MSNYKTAKQAYIEQIKRALYHDSVVDWMAYADYLDVLDEIRDHIEDLQAQARKRRGGK